MNGTTNANIGKIRRQRLAEARLYVLASGTSDVDRFANLISELHTADVDVIQLRDKRHS